MHITTEQIYRFRVESPRHPFELDILDDSDELILRCPLVAGERFDFVHAAALAGHTVQEPDSFGVHLAWLLTKVLRSIMDVEALPEAYRTAWLQARKDAVTWLSTRAGGSVDVVRLGKGQQAEGSEAGAQVDLAAVYISGACVYVGPYSPSPGTNFTQEALSHDVVVDGEADLQYIVESALADLRAHVGSV